MTAPYHPLTGTFDALDASRREWWGDGVMIRAVSLFEITAPPQVGRTPHPAWGTYPDRPRCIMVEAPPSALAAKHLPSDDTEGGACE